MEILVETDVLINVLRNNPDQNCVKLVKQIESENIKGIISTITVFELYYGAYLFHDTGKAVNSVNKLLSIFEVLDLPMRISMQAGKIGAELKNNGLEIDFRDLLIGVTALNFNLKLATLNKKHFSRIPGLEMVEI
jgi:tRNA(fMet)-specific endonuclease VapC